MAPQENYSLICLECQQQYEDTYLLYCPDGHKALLQTRYDDQLEIEEDNEGLFRYINWLPVNSGAEVTSRPRTYHATQLGEELGLTQLYVSFNGYWPEKGATVESCSFKEYEAYPTLQRMKERRQGVIQVSSAGNTARAFAIASSNVDEKVLIIVPSHSVNKVWTLNNNHDKIFFIAVEGDYYDAIRLGKLICDEFENIFPEGGARNVARRDGMGLTMVDATITLGRLPDYYFQGVGSGTGGIAAYEMAVKLKADGNYGGNIPRFFLSQNEPFTPMVSAWNDNRREILEEVDMRNPHKQISQVYATLLTNRKPPYGVKGGVYDILLASNGEMLSVSNDQAKQAFDLFERVEGNDIDPSAAVALASLISARRENLIDHDDVILLNITGGGYKRIEEDRTKYFVMPNHTVRGEITIDGIEEFRDELEIFLSS